MNKYGWKGLRSRYYAATGLLHDREQLQGKQRTLKKLWRFCNLARTHTGVNIDADGYVQATDKWWNDNATVLVFATTHFFSQCTCTAPTLCNRFTCCRKASS